MRSALVRVLTAPVSTPMDPTVTLTKEIEPSTHKEIKFMQQVPYLNAVGALMHLVKGSPS
jgi:hypothetical protein